MTVDEINRNSVLINLTNEEIRALFGGYEKIDYENKACRHAIHKLLNFALPESMFPLDSKSVMINVSKTAKGCIIQFTKVYGKKNLRLRRRKEYVVTFGDCESMIDGVLELKRSLGFNCQSKLYTENGKYCLIINLGKSAEKAIPHIKEYCLSVTESPYSAAVIAEYGNILCESKAIEQIAQAFDN